MIAELKRFHAAERWLLKKLRAWLDRADEFVHQWEVAARAEVAPVVADESTPHGSDRAAAEMDLSDADKTGNRLALEAGGRLLHREGTPRQFKKKRRITAAEFDADMRRRIDARLELAR